MDKLNYIIFLIFKTYLKDLNQKQKYKYEEILSMS